MHYWEYITIDTTKPLNGATKFSYWKTPVSDMLELPRYMRTFYTKKMIFHCCSVRGVPDGVYPEKYNYTYSPCRPVVCNNTLETTAAVSEIVLCYEGMTI